MKTRTVVLTLVLTIVLTLSTGCGNNKNYNNQQDILWGFVKLNQSGGGGTDDAPALNDDKPETHIDQRGNNDGDTSRTTKRTSPHNRSNSNACSKCGDKKGFLHRCKKASNSNSSSGNRGSIAW